MMDPTVEGVKQLLTENFKRKLSDSSNNGGNSPKRRPTAEYNLPEDTPDWGKTLFNRINDMEANITASVDFIMETVAESIKDMGDIKAKQKEQSVKQEDLCYQFAQLKSAYSDLHEKVIRLEDQSRRDNLLIHGFPEVRGESDQDCLRKVYDLLVKGLHIPPDVLNQMRVVRCHRKGPFVKGKNRPIIIKMHFFPDKQYILSCAGSLKGTKFFINEDYSVETESRRRVFYPVMKTARLNPQYKDKVKLQVDRLVVDGKSYKAKDVMDLPDAINPAKIATQTDDQLVKFFGKQSPLSNFHPCQMKVKGVTYCCNEQLYQKAKADEFGDEEAAAKIMATKDPYRIYTIGQNVNNFDADRWSRVCDQHMLEGLIAKFSRPEMKQFLLSTGDAYIAECNGKDAYWGTGLYMDRMRGVRINAWPGKNKLGLLLANVREQIRG